VPFDARNTQYGAWRRQGFEHHLLKHTEITRIVSRSNFGIPAYESSYCYTPMKLRP